MHNDNYKFCAQEPSGPAVWKIVVVSSDSNHLSALGEILKEHEMEPILTSTLAEYRAVLSRESVGLVFCDPELSDGDYRDVINAARSIGSIARIVLSSRQADWQQFAEAVRDGAFDVISSPCRPKDVEWMIIQAKRDDRRRMAKQLLTSNGRDQIRRVSA